MLVWNPETGRMEEVDFGQGGPLMVDGAGGAGGGGAPAPGFAGTTDQPSGQVSSSPLLPPELAAKMGLLAASPLTAIPMAVGHYQQGAQERAAKDKLEDEKRTKEGEAATQELTAAMGQPAPIAPAAPPVPSTITTTSTQRTLVDPGEKPAMAGIKAEAEAGAKATEEMGRIKSEVAGAEAQGLEAKGKLRDEQVTALQAAQDQGDADIEKARTRFASEYEKYSKMEIPDYYAGRMGKRLADAVAVGLSELGRVLSGSGHNTALDIIRGQQQEHYQQARAKIEKQKEAVGFTREGVSDAKASKRDALNDLNIIESAKLAALADKIEAVAKEKGTPFALEEGKRQAAAVRQEAHKLALEAAQGLRIKKISETRPNPAAQPGAGGVNNDRNIYGQGGQPIAQAATPKQAEKANAAIKAYRELDSLMQQLEQSYQTHGKMYNPLRDATGAQKNLITSLKLAYKTAAELGAITGPDMVLIEDAVGGAYTGEQGVAKLRAARNVGRNAHAIALDSFGLPGAQIAKSLSAPASAPAQAGGKKPLTEQDREALNWANANRSDPRAKEILRRHGL